MATNNIQLRAPRLTIGEFMPFNHPVEVDNFVIIRRQVVDALGEQQSHKFNEHKNIHYYVTTEADYSKLLN